VDSGASWTAINDGLTNPAVDALALAPGSGGVLYAATLGGGVFLYVEDVDSMFKKATDAGASVTMAVEDQFWGDRFGSLTDPFGHSWSIATHVEDVPPEEMAERAKQAMAAMSSS